MISIEKMRELDKEAFKNMSDEEIMELRKQMYDLGQLMFDVWLDERNKKTKKVLI